jgi:hypothetical protein
MTTAGNGVAVPPGALEEEVEITVQELDAPVVPPPPQGRAIFALPVLFGPDAQHFSSPVNIILTYTDRDLNGTDPSALEVWRYDASGGLWQLLGGIVDTLEHKLSLDVDHFSLYAIMGSAPLAVGGIAELPEVLSAPLAAPDSSRANHGVPAAAVAVVTAGVAALGAAAWYARRRCVR